MDNIMLHVRKWLEDPFGMRQIQQTHEPLLSELQNVKQEAESKIKRQVRRFPIADSVGNRRLRGETHHAHR